MINQNHRKKHMLLIMLSLIICIVLGIIFMDSNKWRNFTYFYDQNDKISSILIYNGNDGNRINITSPDDIKMISDYLNNLNFSKTNSERITGTSFNFTIFNEDKIAFNIAFLGNLCIINNEYYKIKSPYDINSIYELYDSVIN